LLLTEDIQLSEKILIKSSIHDYNVFFTDDFIMFLLNHAGENDICIIDKTIYQLYKKHFNKIPSHCKIFLIEPSENQKEYSKLSSIIKFLIENEFRKNHKLIAIGGGITQDIVSFIASNLFRGVDWVYYPTTLLSQGDSCIGGKSSINFGKYKNQLGTFYPPEEIIIDTNFLTTLSNLDIRSGLGEMIHFFLVSGEEGFNLIRSSYESAINDQSILQELIKRSLQIKKKIIEIDEFDLNERQLFNYGHSFGHAIESLTNYKIPHGIAVTYGMDIANCLSAKLGYISVELCKEIHELLKKNFGGLSLHQIEIEDFKSALKKDKKNVGSKINVIMTHGIGQMFKTELVMNEHVDSWLKEYFITISDPG
jgi:3-dehydroquinate synthase